MTHEHTNPQLTIWDELGGEPRSMIKPSGWDYHWAQQIDPDAQSDAEVAAIDRLPAHASGGQRVSELPGRRNPRLDVCDLWADLR